VDRPQYGIFTEGTRSHHHLEFSLRDGVSTDDLRAAILGTRLAADDDRAAGGVTVVVGFGPDLWARLSGSADPIRPFPGYRSVDETFEAPSTQRDGWVWVHGATTDDVIDVVRPVVRAWAPVADVALDQTGFVYHDSRDLTGFVDGTANPRVEEAPLVAAVPDGHVGAGGCCAMTMRFRHDLEAFDRLEISEQEQVFGRTKLTSDELPADRKPVDAHISRVEVDDDAGEELRVYRRSVPWATGADQGLYFVAFGADVERFDLQLRHQYGLVDDGVTDRLLRFTTPSSGSFWYCPSVEELDRLAPLPDTD